MKVSFYTLGCRLNQAETAVLQRCFEQAGHEIVEFDDPADVIVINTCTVTEHGDADTRRIVNRIHRSRRETRIALIGCQSQVQGQELLQLPGVHWVVGNQVKMELPCILQQENAPLLMVPEIERNTFTMPAPGIDRKHTRANLKIQDGCDFFCAYCEIPYARGRARSRQFDDILHEARQLAAAGHKELILTGINVGMYRYEEKNIADVTETLSQIDGLLRIRISSIEPTTIPETLFDQMKNGKLCRFMHIPLQSGSDEVLAVMNRRYTIGVYNAFIHDALRTVPNLCLGADVLVGFPGETDSLFEETYEYVNKAPFAYLHVFSYSDRERSRSRRFANKVPRQVINRRSKWLRTLSVHKRQKYFERFIGKTENVLFEQKKGDFWNGLTDTYIRVKVQSEQDLQNRLLPVRLEKIDNITIQGSLV